MPYEYRMSDESDDIARDTDILLALGEDVADVGSGWDEYGPLQGDDPTEGGEGLGSLGIKPLVIGDTYLFALDPKLSPKRPDVFLAKLVEIKTEDLTAHFEVGDEGEIIVFAVDAQDSEYSEYTLLKTTPNYIINDYAIIVPYDDTQDTDDVEEYPEYEIDVEEITDKTHSFLAQTEDVLTRLIYSLGIYDNPSLIRETQEVSETLLQLSLTPDIDKLSDTLYEIHDTIVPITSDNLIIRGEYDEDVENDIQVQTLTGYANYREMLAKTLRIPIFDPSGFYQDVNYSGLFLRDCLQTDSCTGFSGSSYAYDERRNDNGITIPIFKINEDKQSYTVFQKVSEPTPLSFSGYLEEPVHRMTYSLKPSILTHFSLQESLKLYEKFSEIQRHRKTVMGASLLIYQGAIDDQDDQDIGENSFRVRQFGKTIDYEEYSEYVQENAPKPSELVDYLEAQRESTCYNIRDFEKLWCKYHLQYNQIPLLVRKRIDTLISLQIQEYESEQTEIKPIKERPTKSLRELSIIQKIQKSQEYISEIIRDSEKFPLLEQFISIFLRESNAPYEDKHWYYNKYTSEKCLCLHYKYLIQCKNNNHVFETMRSMFGRPPEDGDIYCKVCGEYLCAEEFSTIEGFDEGQPITNQINLEAEFDTEDDRIQEYLDTHGLQANHLKLIISAIGTTLDDRTLCEILEQSSDISQSELCDTRYGLANVGETDTHPHVQSEIAKIREKERKTKDKSEKRALRKQRDQIMITFQKWLRDTNRLLMYVALVSIYIQTSIPPLSLKKDREFYIFDRESQSFREPTLKFLETKLQKLTQDFGKDPFWKQCLQLFNDANNLINQLKNTLVYAMSPRFPIVVKRIRDYEAFVEAQTHQYLKPEWVTFKPLSHNSLNTGISEILMKPENKSSLLRNYSGILIENSAFFRLINESFQQSLTVASICKIPQIEILRNPSFQRLFKLSVSCYGKRPNDVYYTLLILRLLETSSQSEGIKSILKKNGWSESQRGFPNLDFAVWRNSIIPEIFALYKEPGGELKSCYDNPTSCNTYIHTNINNYNLTLLNTHPKRVYGYHEPTVFPELSFERLSQDKPELAKRLFESYRYDPVGDIIRYYGSQDYCDQYLLNVDEELYEHEHLKTLSQNSEGFSELLEFKRQSGKLSYINCYERKQRYSQEDYDLVETLAETEQHFLRWIQNYPDMVQDDYEPINDSLIKLLTDHLKDKSLETTVWTQRYKVGFAPLLDLQKVYLQTISEFLVQCDDIDTKQRSRLTKLLGIKYTSSNLEKLLENFLGECDESLLSQYLNDIQRILVRVSTEGTGTDSFHKIPKEWNLSDRTSETFTKFMIRHLYDESFVINGLLLHDRWMRPMSKDPYPGFRQYASDDPESFRYFQGLFDYLNPYLQNLEDLKGSEGQPYNPKISLIYQRFHLVHILHYIIQYIGELKDTQSEVAKDANLLFIALEQRDEDVLERAQNIISRFLADILTHLLMTHYDGDWIHMNSGDKLSKNLSKQREREKQKRIRELDSASGSEERELMRAKQEYGMTNWWKEASDAAAELTQTAEFQQMSESERLEAVQAIYTNLGLDLADIPVAPDLAIHGNADDVGEDVNDFAEDYEDYEDDDGGDEDDDNEFNE